MESSIQLRISHYLSEADEYYLKGKYDKCEHTLRLLREEVDETKSLLEVCSMKKCVFSCIIESNILISKVLVSIMQRVVIVIGSVPPQFSLRHSSKNKRKL
jgi:hypothetical protein